jgi:tetratricopeptide (TPR) repeat protein
VTLTALADIRGTIAAAPSEQALTGFEVAVRSLYGFHGDPLAHINPIIRAWPQFCLAHIFRALVLLGFTERRFANGAAESLARAEPLLADAGERERTLFDVGRHMLAGDRGAAIRLLEACLLADPLDILALHLAHNLDFFRGDLFQLRNRVSRVLPCWQEGMPGYAHVLGMQAFGLEECNQYPDAERTAERSLELEPDNPWAVHALAHVYEMQGRVDEGIAHLESRVDDWSADSGFAYHNWWHLALFYLERCDELKVLSLYDAQFIEPDARYALNMIDAAALLWRLHLLGIDAGDRPLAVAKWWRGHLTDGGGYYAFNDFHAAIALTLVGDAAELEALQQRLAGDSGSSENAAILREIAAPLIGAMLCYARGDFADAARRLAQHREAAQRLGGSHAQRDLITLTLIDAAIRAGMDELARRYLNERLLMKPASPLSARFTVRMGSE